MSNDFKDLNGLPPEMQPHKPKEVPKELSEVKKADNQKVSLNLSDYWNIVKAIFRNEALAQLEGKSMLYETALNFRYAGMVIVGIIVFVLFIGLFK